jgi:acyl-CoA synthetase (AMP-forming)/AMP-acid ligase II
MNVGELLRKAARTHRARSAIEDSSRALTYGELDLRTDRIAAGLLDLGLAPGDRVALLVPNRVELVECLFAIFKAGLVAVPLNVRLHPREITYILSNSAAAALVLDSDLDTARDVGTTASSSGTVRIVDAMDLPEAERRRPAIDIGHRDPAWLFYTSGTTGRPKGAVLTHGNLKAMTMSCLADLYSFQPEDVVLHAAPLTHGSGLYLLPSIARGASNLIQQGSFSPTAVFESVARRGVTAIAFLAPTQIVAMIEHPDAARADMLTLSCVIYGGGPMYVRHIRQALDLWGPIWVQLYGQGETPMTGTYLRREDHLGEGEDQERRLGSIGIPRTDIELRIVDHEDSVLEAGKIGELIIRGDTVMSGYWNDPDSSAEALRDGWLRTGDLGYQDDDGYVHLVDRAKDMIISGGNNIYAREVEDAILAHPAVVEVAVVGVPDDYWGESVHACIVPRADASVTEAEIIDHCRTRLASYKKPSSVEFVTELPKNAYGKVLKRELRKPGKTVRRH